MVKREPQLFQGLHIWIANVCGKKKALKNNNREIILSKRLEEDGVMND